MAKVTRRDFIVGASVGVVAVGVGVGVPALVAATHSPPTSRLSSPLTVYVRDASKGEIVLLADAKQVIIHDTDLAARLFKAAQ